MLKVNLHAATNVAAQPCGSTIPTQPQSLRAASQFALADSSATHLIHRPDQTSIHHSFAAQATPVVFALGDGWKSFNDEYWYITGPTGILLAVGLLYLMAKGAERIWPSLGETHILNDDEPGEDFIGPQFAPGSKDLPKGEPIDE